MALQNPPGTVFHTTHIGRRATAAAQQAAALPPVLPAWIREARGDRAAERHGLGIYERDALGALTAEALLTGGPIAGGDDVWAEVSEAGARWPNVRRTLERRGRIRIYADDGVPEAFLVVVWVQERLAEAARSSEQARTNRSGSGSGGRARPPP